MDITSEQDPTPQEFHEFLAGIEAYRSPLLVVVDERALRTLLPHLPEVARSRKVRVPAAFRYADAPAGVEFVGTGSLKGDAAVAEVASSVVAEDWSSVTFVASYPTRWRTLSDRFGSLVVLPEAVAVDPLSEADLAGAVRREEVAPEHAWSVVSLPSNVHADAARIARLDGVTVDALVEDIVRRHVEFVDSLRSAQERTAATDGASPKPVFVLDDSPDDGG